MKKSCSCNFTSNYWVNYLPPEVAVRAYRTRGPARVWGVEGDNFIHLFHLQTFISNSSFRPSGAERILVTSGHERLVGGIMMLNTSFKDLHQPDRFAF